jgi:hypothetical protein
MDKLIDKLGLAGEQLSLQERIKALAQAIKVRRAPFYAWGWFQISNGVSLKLINKRTTTMRQVPQVWGGSGGGGGASNGAS